MSAASSAKAGAKPEEVKKPRRRIKKVAGHGGHHGGAWKVAYADFVTAMMALFLVLWLLSQADTKLKESIATYFRSPGAFDKVQGGILEGSKTFTKTPLPSSEQEEQASFLETAMSLQKKFSTRPQFQNSKDRIRVEVTPEGLKIQIIDKADKVSFASGSADLTETTREILEEIAQDICELSNPIHLGGHTDRRPFGKGSSYTNWELSADRANAARRALESNCVDSSQIRRVVGYADTEPLIPTDAYAAANRRISILVVRLHKEGEKSDADQEFIEKKPEGSGADHSESTGKKEQKASEQAHSPGAENTEAEHAEKSEMKRGRAASQEKTHEASEKEVTPDRGKSGEKSENSGHQKHSSEKVPEKSGKPIGKRREVRVGEPDKIPRGVSHVREH
jgi:chemotaxis protein MotB